MSQRNETGQNPEPGDRRSVISGPDWVKSVVGGVVLAIVMVLLLNVLLDDELSTSLVQGTILGLVGGLAIWATLRKSPR